MRQFRRDHPRLMGFILFLIGVGSFIALDSAYRTGGSMSLFTIMLAAAGFIYGTAVMIEPRIMLSYEDHTIDRKFRVMSFIIMAAILVITFAVRYTLFKEWR